MCSTCDCDKNSVLHDIRQLDSDSSSGVSRCRRCGSEPFIILDRVHVECRACFLESCNKKLRSTIGKSKLLSNNDPILIAHSGGASSTALLDLVKNSIEFNFRREQKFRPSILYIDMQSIYQPDNVGQRLSSLDSFLGETKQTYPGWPIYWTTIEMIGRKPSSEYFDTTTTKPFYLKYETNLSGERPPDLLADLNALNCFRSELLELTSLTDKQHFVRKSTADLIARVAEHINLNHESVLLTGEQLRCVFSASTGTQLANELLVDVILGEGATCHSTVSICDSRHSVPIVRPMRDFSKKEIAFYLLARNLPNRPTPNLATLGDSKASIQKLTESFLSKLSADYPSTYSTLLRTGNKLQDS